MMLSSMSVSQLGENATLTESGEKFMSRLVVWEDLIVGSYLSLVSTLAILLNTLVIYTCFRNWNSLVTSDYYILNLACSDLILPMCAFPLAISSSYKHFWIFGDIGCTVYGFLGFFFGLVSITTLTIMGATRYISICHPDIDFAESCTTKRVIVCAYLYSFLWSLIPLTGWGSYTVEAYGTSCTIQWGGNKTFITLMSLFCIVAPSIIIAVAYGLILLKCRKSARKVSNWRTRKSKCMSRKEGYLIKMTFAMCWAFLITWMPYAVVSMWTAYGDPTMLPTRLTVMAVLTAKSSTVVNPIIYVLMSRKFQPMLRQIFKNFYTNCSTESISVQGSPQVSIRTSDKTLRSSDGDDSYTSSDSTSESRILQVKIETLCYLKESPV